MTPNPASRSPANRRNRLLAATFAALACAAPHAVAAPPVSDADAAALAAIAPPPTDIDPPAVAARGQALAGDVGRLWQLHARLDVAATEARAPGEGRLQAVLRRAMGLLGTPYRWGGTSPERGFDCSGLVGYVYRTALGIDLPRVSRDQARAGERVADRAAMAAGDLVFFGRRGRVDHVGIYIGDGKFVHAPRRGKDVTVSSLDGGYWGNKFLQARRIAL